MISYEYYIYNKNDSINDIGFYTYVPNGNLLDMVASKVLRKGVYYELQATVTGTPFTGIQRSYMYYIAPTKRPVPFTNDSGYQVNVRFSGGDVWIRAIEANSAFSGSDIFLEVRYVQV